MENIIEVDHLSFEYEKGSKTIDDISFSIKKGSYTVILGHNGSGKSTITKLLIGLLEKNDGTIKINGHELDNEDPYPVRKEVGIVFQNPDNQFIGATVRDDIAFGLENRCIDPKDMEQIIQEYATYVSMQNFLDHEPTKLSGGQKQRVAIAGILAMHPSVLILDEATSMLDPKGRNEINHLVRSLNEKEAMTVFSITHDIEEAVYADQVILLHQGKIVKDGSPEEVLSDEDLLKSLGLDVPFAYRLSSLLYQQGLLDKKEIREEKLVNKLCQLYSKK